MNSFIHILFAATLFVSAPHLDALDFYPEVRNSPECTGVPNVPKPYETIPEVNNFFLSSIPKSGTHMMVKLLIMLTGRSPRYMRPAPNSREIDLALTGSYKANVFLYHHTGNFPGHAGNDINAFGIILGNYLIHNTTCVQLFQIRDLRDVFVSLVNYLDKRSPNIWQASGLGQNPTFSDKLTYAIQTMLASDLSNVSIWLNNPHSMIVRFEDLVGPSGGGNAEVQEETIVKIANALGFSLSQEKLEHIKANLFGDKSGPKVVPTFHNGKIGSWKAKFNDEHKRLFNEIWGETQQALGYPLAE